jgi:hypothetical protein
MHSTKHHPMKTYRGMEVKLHVFLTSVLDRCEWSTDTTAALPPARARAGLDTVSKRKIHFPFREWNSGRLAHSQVATVNELEVERDSAMT